MELYWRYAFPMFIFLNYIFYQSLQIIRISYVHKTSTLSNSNKSHLVDNSGSWPVVSLILKFVNDQDRGWWSEFLGDGTDED